MAIAWGMSLCRIGKKVRFATAAALVTQLEEAQQQHRLDRTLGALDRLDLLIVDELGYLSFGRAGAELLFQVFADRYERRIRPLAVWRKNGLFVGRGLPTTAVLLSACAPARRHGLNTLAYLRDCSTGSRPPRAGPT